MVIAIETPADFYSVELNERDICPVCNRPGILNWTLHEPDEKGYTSILCECSNPSCGAAFPWNVDFPSFELAPEVSS